MNAPTWYQEKGRQLIRERVDRYTGLGLWIWLSNLDLVPDGVEYRELQELITECPCRYIEEYDDIVLFFN